MSGRNSKDLKVVLVEDVETTRLFMRLELEQHGFIVFEAEDGRRAVEVATKESPDVILMDLTLPYMDGLSAAKLIRKKSGKLQTVPIIAVTAHQETISGRAQKLQGLMRTLQNLSTSTGSRD